MPKYEFECRACGRQFELEMSYEERERKSKEKKIRCPKCNSNEVEHLVESVFVTTSKKS